MLRSPSPHGGPRAPPPPATYHASRPHRRPERCEKPAGRLPPYAGTGTPLPSPQSRRKGGRGTEEDDASPPPRRALCRLPRSRGPSLSFHLPLRPHPQRTTPRSRPRPYSALAMPPRCAGPLPLPRSGQARPAAASHLQGGSKPVAKKTDGVNATPYIPCAGAGLERHVTTPGGPSVSPRSPAWPKGAPLSDTSARGGCVSQRPLQCPRGPLPPASTGAPRGLPRLAGLLCAAVAGPAGPWWGSGGMPLPAAVSEAAEVNRGSGSAPKGAAGAPRAPRRTLRPRAGGSVTRCITARSRGMRQFRKVPREQPQAN